MEEAGMKSLKGILVTVVGLVLITTSLAPSGFASTVDEQYAGSQPPERVGGTIGAIYDPSREDSFGPSFLFAGDQLAPQQVGFAVNAITCSDAKDAACANQRQFMEFLAYLQECTSAVLTDCVASVTAIKNDGTEVPGVFIRRVPAKGPTEFEGDPLRKIPDGSSPGLWRFSGITHQGGTDFLVAVSLGGRSPRDAVVRSSGQLKMAIFPVSSVAPAREGGVMKIGLNSDGSYSIQGSFDRSHIYHAPIEALNRWPFPTDIKFRLTVRLSDPQLGWLHGRVLQPSARITNDVNGQEITVEAAPVSVPLIDPWTKWSDLPNLLRNTYVARNPGGDFCKGWVEDKWEDLCINVGGNSSANEETMRVFLEWVKIAKDEAVASKSTWSVRSMRDDEITGKAECYRGDKTFVGFVATNSTVYLAGPPSFNRDAQSLDYKVASPHFFKGGLNYGTYSLLMRSDTARCIYGFSDAPISATVSVLSSDGSAQVATTNVAQKDGWLSLNAAGFTYSSPTVRVAIKQEVPAPVVTTTPTPIPTPSPTASPSSAISAVKKTKKTISCTNGVRTTKVRAENPKCPKGFKRA
jgi:hypothetical protein